MKDLLEEEIEDGMRICTWMDEGFIFTTIGFITFCLDRQDFTDFVRCMSKTNVKLIKIENEEK